MTFDPNLLSFTIAPVVTGILTYMIMRASKGTDARAAAEAALIGIGPAIIRDQNARIEYLTKQIDNLYVELNKAYERERHCMERLYRLEKKVNGE